MREPRFWQAPQPGGRAPILARLLTPVSHVYDLSARWRRRFIRPEHAPVPVVCIGNVTLGGAGKTPLALAIAQHFQSQDYLVHFLSRGYGGSEKGPLQVDPAQHLARDVGDEPLLLARTAPTWVSSDRVEGSVAAVKAGARLIIMDDGLQNPALEKDFSLLAVDAVAGTGNGRLFPAGPLRERPDDALARSNVVVVIGRGHAGDGIAARAQARGVPVFRAILRPSPLQGLDGAAVIAFAGIGRPEKFFQTLRDLRADIVMAFPYPDHHNFTERDAKMLLAKADETGARLITTEKDFVRLNGAVANSARATLGERTTVLPIRILIDNFSALSAMMQAVIARPDIP